MAADDDAPASATHQLPSAHQPHSRLSSSTTSRRPSHPSYSPIMTGNEGLPIRHPRPLTAAEIYLELEREQEAVVNKLTRELTQLRAQHSASVASNTSHSSAASSLLPIDPNDTNAKHHITGPTHPTPSRRHRSSSSLSGRSHTSISQPTSAKTPVHGQAPSPTVTKASVDRAAAAVGPPSRNPSVSARSATSGTSTPARQVGDQHGGMSAAQLSTNNVVVRPSLPGHTISNMSLSDMSTCPIAGSMLPSPAAAATPKTPFPFVPAPTDDTERLRLELERVKLDNHELRHRIKELERALRSGRERQGSDLSSPAATRGSSETRINTSMPPPGQGVGSPRPGSAAGQPFTALTSAGGVSVSAWAAGTSGAASIAGPRRERSESQSTTASSRRGHVTEDKDDVVRVGESAGNAGLR